MYSEQLKKIVFNPPNLPKITDKDKEIELQREVD
jgi:hypothetical protein